MPGTNSFGRFVVIHRRALTCGTGRKRDSWRDEVSASQQRLREAAGSD